VAVGRDVTERKLAEEKIQHLAFYDALTKLPNRQLLMDRLHAALSDPGRPREGALMFIDLDNFKVLNDTLGHQKGDMLLQLVAERLRSCVAKGDTVARLGGDEFVILLENRGDKPLEPAKGRARGGRAHPGGAGRALRAARLPAPQHLQHRRDAVRQTTAR
jgi:GGDEF domain-containing protein